MQIETLTNNSDGTDTLIVYKDVDTFESLDFDKIRQIYAVCLSEKGEMVIALHGRRQTWSLVGGSIEQGESLEECLRREIQEESNMKVLSYRPIGYQSVQNDERIIYQLRYFCAVEPYGEFISDPAGAVVEIKLIDPKDYKIYFDWGEIGDRIVERALELSNHDGK